MKRILFTGGGGAASEALWRLIGNKYELYFADADIKTINPNIPKASCYQIPYASESNFIDEIDKICKSKKIDVLIPTVDEELLKLAKNVNDLRPTKLMLPDINYIEMMLDKLSMVDAMNKNNITAPSTIKLQDDISNIKYPCICKPRKGRGSRNVREIDNLEQLKSFKKLLGDDVSQYIVQNKIEGTEYTVQMVANAQGKLDTVVPVRVNIKKGITISAEIDPKTDVIATCELIHNSIPTSGCYNIQLIQRPNGQAIPFEINPRISTTFCLAIAAGIDPISVFLDEKIPKEQSQFYSRIKLRRYWSNHFSDASTDL